MSVTGLCGICESARASQRCDRCGTLVCRDHYDLERSMCTQCAAQYRARDDLVPG